MDISGGVIGQIVEGRITVVESITYNCVGDSNDDRGVG